MKSIKMINSITKILLLLLMLVSVCFRVSYSQTATDPNCLPEKDEPINEHLFLYDDFEEPEVKDTRWTLVIGQATQEVFIPSAPIASATYPFPATGSQAVTLTCDEDTGATRSLLLGKCFQPVPQDGEKLFMEVDIFKDSNGFATGTNGFGSNRPLVLGMAFTTGIPDIATQTISLRITSLPKWPTIAGIAIVYSRGGKDLIPAQFRCFFRGSKNELA